ncbi:MAG: hypothetical protein NTW66_04595 [Candidatus Magasanikbacteria bacterium]|nr:hypothetical protein [Candidatus Magasanikbacteria bacterium]
MSDGFGAGEAMIVVPPLLAGAEGDPILNRHIVPMIKAITSKAPSNPASTPLRNRSSGTAAGIGAGGTTGIGAGGTTGGGTTGGTTGGGTTGGTTGGGTTGGTTGGGTTGGTTGGALLFLVELPLYIANYLIM